MRVLPRSDAPAPFIKWAGGKGQLLPQILPRIPREIGTYYEPFLGGGAVFFALAEERRFERAVVSDFNKDLVDTYLVVRDAVEDLIELLARHRTAHSTDYYYRLRDAEIEELPSIERAARVIYLNKTGFNGLYRVNSRGKFNVPVGRYRNPNICDPVRLRAASSALKNVEIRHASFEYVADEATPGDFVYFDPPYVPLSKSSSFTAYSSGGFADEHQMKLANVLRALRKKKVPALLSNSDCDRTRDLYDKLPFDSVPVARSINSDATRRGAVKELLVQSFKYPLGR